MSINVRRPRWWILYVAVLLGAALFWLEAHAPLSDGWHRAAQVGVLLVVFGAVETWRLCNMAALIHEDMRSLPPLEEHEIISSSLTYSFEWPCGDPLDMPPVLHTDQAERKA